MDNDKKYSLEQLRSAWGAGMYSASENDDYSKENILASIEEFEKKIKKPSYKCFIEHWGLLRRRYIKNEKLRFNSRYNFIAS